MSLTLATFAYPLYEMRTLLDGREYILTFDYNGREDRWYMTVADIDGSAIYRGVKMVTGIPLLARCADRRRPAGDFMVIGPTDPGFEQWGTDGTAVLVYFTEEEILDLIEELNGD